jgi:hypothetical protein
MFLSQLSTVTEGDTMTAIEELHYSIEKWKKLGWLPYCPKGVRKYIPFIPFYLPYKLMQRKYK